MSVITRLHSLSVVAAGAILALSAPAAARTQVSQAPAASDTRQTQATVDPNRRICVRSMATGSRIPQQLCRTARQWEEIEGEIPTSGR